MYDPRAKLDLIGIKHTLLDAASEITEYIVELNNPIADYKQINKDVNKSLALIAIRLLKVVK